MAFINELMLINTTYVFQPLQRVDDVSEILKKIIKNKSGWVTPYFPAISKSQWLKTR